MSKREDIVHWEGGHEYEEMVCIKTNGTIENLGKKRDYVINID